MALSWAGRPEEALAPIDTGTRLDPRYPAYFLFAEGQAYFGMQDWTAAIDAFRRCIGRNPDLMPSHAFLAASLSIIGGTREAQESCSEILRLNPGFTIFDFRRMVPYKRKADLEHLLSGLSGAGLPE